MKLHLPVRLRQAVTAILATLAPSATSVGSCAMVGTSAAIGLLGMQAYAGWSAQYADTYLYTGETTIDLTSSTVPQGYYCLRPGGVASCSGEVELLKAGNGVEVKLCDDWPAGNNNNFTTGFVIKELRFAEGAGANTLTVQDGQSATVEKVTGSPVDINFHEAGELILAGTAGTVHALRNINFLDKDRNNVFNRNLTISEGVTVQVSHLDNFWGMGVLMVNGTLNVTDSERGFYMSSGANNSTENNVITGTGTVNTQTLICQNAGTYNFSVNALNVEGLATLQANVNIMDGTLAFNGATTMNSTVALYDGAILQNNAEEAIRFGENFRLNIENLTEQVADDGSRVYTILGGSGNKDLSSLSTSQLLAHYSNGWDWSFNQNGTIVATRLGRDVSYAGGTLSWSTAADNKSFTQGSAAVSFEQGDNVTFAGDSQVTLAEDIQATRVIVGREAEVAVHTAGHALAADFVEVEGALRYQLGGENSSILDLKGAGTLVLDNADADSAASFSIGGDVSAFTGGLTVQGNTTLALHGKANDLVSASEASVTIGDGSVLKVENIAGWHTIWRLNAAKNLHTTGTGTIDVVDRGWLTEDVDIDKNFSCETSFLLHGDGVYSNMRRNVFVGEGSGFYVDDTLTLMTYVALVVQGGTIDAGTLAVGNDPYWSKFFMSSGLLTAGSIKLSSRDDRTEVNISGGCVEFTQSQALNRAGYSAPYVRIVGSGPDSTVTLKATRTDWTLDGAGLNNKPVIGNITVDAGNTHGITLANVALTGSIVNNAELTLGEGVSVAAGSSAVLSGASIAIDRTITNAGTLSLQTGSVSVSRENLQRLEISTEDATIAYSLDGKNFVTDGSENGFRHLTNARYYLAAGGNLSVAQGLQAQVGENSYNIFADATGLGFIAPETSRSDVFVVNSGNVTVGAEAQAIAESYEINGGTMVLNAGSVAGESVHFNSASSALHIGGESSITGVLVLNQGSVTVSGGHVNTLNVAGGSATLNGGSADTLLVGGSNGSVEVTGAFSTTCLRLSENGSAMLTVKDGGNLTITGTNNVHSTNSSFMLGHWPYSSTLRQEGGEVNAREAIMYTSWDGTGSYQALGGVANLKGIHFWAHNGGAFAGSFLLGDETTGSARVNFGSFGIVDINSSVLVKLGNGTLGATADWGMTYNGGYAAAAVQLIGTTTGTIFNTEDAFAPGTGHIINITPVLTGNGKLVKEGIGSLYLKGANTYSGGTVIQGGELVTSQASSLGSGAVYLKDGSLTLNADLSISSLDYSGGNLNANGYNLTITDSLTVRKQLIINGSQNGAFPLNGLKTLSFINSTADSLGGAIKVNGNSSILLHNNGNLSFSGNSAKSDGGAIYGYPDSTITLSSNGSVSFIENTASSSGGAIYTGGSLLIRDNDSVEFAGNVEKNGSAYRLRSVYVSGGSDAVLNISAAAGKTVSFHDSIYVGSDTTVNFNADYEDAEGNLIEQKGDILFTGATTVNDLYKAKDNVAGTEEEIRLSRTTEVNAMTNLYGGRLRVEDGSIYQGYGITVHEGSEATVLVKDATLSHSGYNLTFNAGTALELEGNSQLVGNLMMLSGSFLTLDSTMNLEGTLTLGSGIVLGGTLLDDILSMELGDTLTLVSGLESVSIQTQSLMRSLEYTTLLSGELVNASDYFENLKGHADLVFSYDSNTQTLKIIYAIPEPATTTLSLLALAALAARRRRK